MIERTLFTPDHEAFRDSFRRFMDKEIAPFHEDWESHGYVDRALWNKAGENGFLCMSLPEEHGGAGADLLYSVIQFEELWARGFTGVGFGLHSEIVARTSCTTAPRPRRRTTCPSWRAARWWAPSP
jgi:alkylation response protein AidB-like acyl-CoA dehydrogenase